MTGEHKAKRSDLRALFGDRSQSSPLYHHDADQRNVVVRGLNSRLLKFRERICARCNNDRTQPHDRAWERMSEWLRTAIRDDTAGTSVNAAQIFGADSVREMLNVHLFFVKHFGCCIRENGIAIDLAPFSDAIMNGTACPTVYLKFGRSLTGDATAGLSNMEIDWLASDSSCAVASYVYCVGGLAVMVMFIAEGEQPDGLMDAWHPRLGTEKLVLADF